MVFPPPPTDKFDWGNVGFLVRDVNGHIQTTYSKTTGEWSTPKLVADPHLTIHGMAPGLNYGQQCYEGLKACRGPGDTSINIFRPDQNALRMQHSARFVAMPPVPTALFLHCVHMAVAANAEFVPPHASGCSLYIRPLLFGSCRQLGLNPPDEYTFCVYVTPTGVYHGIHPVDCLVLEDFDRSAPDGTGSAKIGGNYAPVLIHSEAARQQGYNITLHLDAKTRNYIDEFSTSGFLGVKKPKDGAAKPTLVATESKNIIKSVTSDSVLKIARDVLGWNTESRPVPLDEIGEFSDIMAAGTAASLVPIKSITVKSKNLKIDYSGEEASADCVEFLRILKGVQFGKEEDKWGWLHPVKEDGSIDHVKIP